MGNGLIAKRDYLLNLNEMLLSLNLGLAVAIGLRVYISQFPAGRNGVADVFLRTVSEINGFFHLVQYDHVGVDITFVALTAGLASTAVLLLRAIALTPMGRPVLNLIGGLVAIAALPTCWFYMGRVLWPVPHLSVAACFFVVGVPVACAFLYLYGMWPIPIWVTIPMLALYYGLWSWMLWQHFAHDLTALVFPAVGMCSSTAWGLFVRRQRPGR